MEKESVSSSVQARLGFSEIVAAADQSFNHFAQSDFERFISSDKDSRELVARIMAVHLAGKTEPAAYEAFLNQRNVVPSVRALNEFHSTFMAFFPEGERKALRVRISQYAQVAHVLHVHGVAPDQAAVWFDTRTKVGGKMLTRDHQGPPALSQAPGSDRTQRVSPP